MSPDPGPGPQVCDGLDGATLDAAALALDSGRVVAIPTDTVYGLAARVDRSEGIEAVFTAKRRPSGVALPVLVSDVDQALEVADSWPPSAAVLAARFWPGALTLVVPAPPALSRLLRGDGRTVGLRLSANPLVQALCARAGPLAVTSANFHGAPPCSTASEVARSFDARSVVLVVDGGECRGEPSTVLDCTVAPPRCLREGPVTEREIAAALEGSPQLTSVRDPDRSS